MINNLPSISVLIPDAEDWQAVKVLRCLGQVPTVSAHILSKKRKPLPRFSRFCSSAHRNTGQNDREWIDEINKLVRKLQIDVILPVTLKGVELISSYRREIREPAVTAPVSEPEKVSLANDKWAFHKFITEQALPSVPTLNVGKAGEDISTRNLDSIEFPALLKPASEAGGFGIVKVEKALDLENARHDRHIMKNKRYILQSFVPGKDLCLQVFCKSGKILSYTLQKSLSRVNGDYFGPQRIMEFAENEEVLSLGNKIVSLMQWDGIACIDFRLDTREEKLWVLEINPRFGQAVLGSLLAGVNFPVMACYSALDVLYPAAYKKTRYAHPLASAKVFASRICRRGTSLTQLHWSESGLKFTWKDPVPEIVDFMNRTVFKFKRRIKNGRSLTLR